MPAPRDPGRLPRVFHRVLPGYACLLAVAACGDGNAWVPPPRCADGCSADHDCVGGQRCEQGQCVHGTAASEAAPRVVLDETHGTLRPDFRTDVTGNGTHHVGSVALTGNVGTVEVDGVALPAVAYSRSNFPGYTLFQTLAVARERWVILWLYCRGGTLSDVYLHTTDGLSTTHETASGSCTDEVTTHDVTVDFPAVDLAVSPLQGRFRVAGRNLTLDGPRVGAIRLDGRELLVLPYNHVDCTRECGPPGWQEVHALLVDTTTRVACFAIIYLFPTDDEAVVAYSLSLPTLAEPADNVRLCARWRTTDGR
ncbi:MAG: hypothetical protein AB2A00_41815 [Myxococcota bacterium]